MCSKGPTEVASVEHHGRRREMVHEHAQQSAAEGKHAFTAYATEKSAVGNADGKSETVAFEVDTEPPGVSIVGPPSPSNDTTPAFSGTASENTEVTVHVFEGADEVGSASTTASGGTWA